MKLTAASLARSSLGAYVATRPNYSIARHHRLISQALSRVAEGSVRRLMVFAPPRHGKSQLVSGFYPAWYLGTKPRSQVIFATYSASYARDWGRKVRDQINEPDYHDLFGVRVRGDSSATDRFELSNGSVYFALGVGGPATGRGANTFIIDDPVKDALQAQSEAYQRRTIDWYESVASTRLMPGASIVIIMTRWHENDLCGYLLKNEPGQWAVLRLPALADSPNDPLGRAEGEALWPEWYPVEAFESRRANRWWSALYQQSPQPPSGALLKREWWRYYDRQPHEFEEVVASWDCAFKGTETSDFVVGQVWGRIGSDCYLLESIRERADFPRTVQLIVQQLERWDGFNRPSITTALVEDKANGSAVISTLRDRFPTMIGIDPEGGKVSRAHAVSALIEAGHVFLPEHAPWVHDFIDECAAFPVGSHDDQVDAMTQALSRMIGHVSAMDLDFMFNPKIIPRARV